MNRHSKFSGTVSVMSLAAAVAVSVAPLYAQGSAAARVIEMTGRVSIWHDSGEVPLFDGSLVQAKQLIRTGPDGYAKFQLADGSTFEVFQNAQVVFHSNPSSWTDLLDVVIGRVKVFIQHRDGPNPNRVTTQTAVISVRGTVFAVAVEDEDATTLVSVDDGVVGVQHRLLPGAAEIHAGESLRVYRNQPLARRMDKGSVAQKALRAAAQALYDLMLVRSAGGVGGPARIPTGNGPPPVTGQGDKGGKSAPPPPPPPPPSPPPPPPPPQ